MNARDSFLSKLQALLDYVCQEQLAPTGNDESQTLRDVLIKMSGGS